MATSPPTRQGLLFGYFDDGHDDARDEQRKGGAPSESVDLRIILIAQRSIQSSPDPYAWSALRTRTRGGSWIECRHERGLWKNNRAENSHQPTRRRERKMQRFKSPGSAQKFLSVHSAVFNTFNVQRHLTSRDALRVLRDEAFRTWEAATAA